MKFSFYLYFSPNSLFRLRYLIWFTRLFTNSAYPADHLNRPVDKVAEKASTLSETELKEFFEKRVNFDFNSSSLDQHGVTRLLDQGSIKKCRVTNEMVVDLVHFFRKENYSTSTFFFILSLPFHRNH